VNLQPFLECHCPCTSFLPRLARTTSGERAPPVCPCQSSAMTRALPSSHSIRYPICSSMNPIP
jgi:hypothetical protein